MMHFVHVRCDDDQPQESIEIAIHSNIGVFHLRVQARKNQVDDDNPEWDTENKDCG